MNAGEIDVTFGPSPGDRTELSKAGLATLEVLYRHPVSHNLDWSDVVALFTRLGAVHHKPNNQVAFEVGGEHHLVRKPHTKELTAAEIMVFRHLLTRAGWSPDAATRPTAGPDRPNVPAVAADDLLVVVEHDAARLYHLDVHAANPVDDVIRPADPHSLLHHPQPRERDQGPAEDPAFYERIAAAVAASGRIVVIGHGEGHSNAAHHLVEHLRRRHPETFRKVTREVVADLSSLTPAQLLVLGRRALSS